MCTDASIWLLSQSWKLTSVHYHRQHLIDPVLSLNGPRCPYPGKPKRWECLPWQFCPIQIMHQVCLLGRIELMWNLHQWLKFRQTPLPKLQTVAWIPANLLSENTVIHPGGGWGTGPVLPRLSRSLPNTPEPSASELSEVSEVVIWSSWLGVIVGSLGGGPGAVVVAMAAATWGGGFSNTVAASAGGGSWGTAIALTVKIVAKMDKTNTLASILNKKGVEDRNRSREWMLKQLLGREAGGGGRM